MTLISLLNICSKAPELFESSKVEQKRQLINFLLSNLKLRGKTLEFELKKPYDAIYEANIHSNWLLSSPLIIILDNKEYMSMMK